MRRLAVLPLATILLATGCGDIPQPFRHEGAPPPLARPKMPRGLTIRPVADTPEGETLARALAEALAVQEIPASVASGPVFGHVVEAVASAQDGRKGLAWTLVAPDGTVTALRFQPAPLHPRDTKQTAEILASRLTDPDAAPPAHLPPPKRTTIRLLPFSGLPGDGDGAMTRASRTALERAGMVVSDQGGDYIVQARVVVVPGLPGEDTVVVTWIVKTSDGRDLATIDQEGVVPRGRLASAWGALARDIAEGGAVGVLDVVKSAPVKP